MAIEKVVNKTPLKQRTNDAAYWRAQPPELRLAALEEIRQEYHRWRYGAEPRLQRVCSIRIVRPK
jgi:hypothetical protein